MDRGPVAGTALGDDVGTETAGHLSGVVGAVVVDHEWPIPDWHTAKHAWQRRRLVEAGQHHRHEAVGHTNRRYASGVGPAMVNSDKRMTSALVAAHARLVSKVVTRVLIADDDTVVRDVVRRY